MLQLLHHMQELDSPTTTSSIIQKSTLNFEKIIMLLVSIMLLGDEDQHLHDLHMLLQVGFLHDPVLRLQQLTPPGVPRQRSVPGDHIVGKCIVKSELEPFFLHITEREAWKSLDPFRVLGVVGERSDDAAHAARTPPWTTFGVGGGVVVDAGPRRQMEGWSMIFLRGRSLQK